MIIGEVNKPGEGQVTEKKKKIPDLHPLLENATVTLTLGSDRHQFDSFTGDEVERFVNVGDLVDSHLSSFRFGQTFA